MIAVGPVLPARRRCLQLEPRVLENYKNRYRKFTQSSSLTASSDFAATFTINS